MHCLFVLAIVDWHQRLDVVSPSIKTVTSLLSLANPCAAVDSTMDTTHPDIASLTAQLAATTLYKLPTPPSPKADDSKANNAALAAQITTDLRIFKSRTSQISRLLETLQSTYRALPHSSRHHPEVTGRQYTDCASAFDVGVDRGVIAAILGALEKIATDVEVVLAERDVVGVMQARFLLYDCGYEFMESMETTVRELEEGVMAAVLVGGMGGMQLTEPR